MARQFVSTIALIVLIMLGGITPNAGQAQNKYEAVITVNGDGITPYEISQRTKFFQVIGQRGKTKRQIEDELIEDRLRLQAAKRNGIALTKEGLETELERFAGRADLTVDQFAKILRSNGVDIQTARDFIEANITWREVVRARFAGQGNISETEIDRALENRGSRGGLQVLFSEIVLPARPQLGEVRRAKRLANRITKIRSTSKFSAEARKYSASPTRRNGGRLQWTDISDVPAPLRPILLALKPGEVTAPLEVTNAILLFQLRDVRETTPKKRQVSAIEYATIDVPSQRTNDIMARIDVCDDLYGVAKKLGGTNLVRDTKKPDAIAKEISLLLSRMDANEVSVTPGPADTNTIVMMCGRSFVANEDASREVVSDQLRQRRLSSLADGYLAELRAKARIVRK